MIIITFIILKKYSILLIEYLYNFTKCIFMYFCTMNNEQYIFQFQRCFYILDLDHRLVVLIRGSLF